MLCACADSPNFPHAAPSTGKRHAPLEQEFHSGDLLKSDIDIAAEVHLQESLASSRLLMEKLYRRNPREWRKGNYRSMDAALDRAFDPQAEFFFPELGNARGVEALLLGLKREYSGDRVFAFGVGLASMV
ncbi:MAG: hypothetical protein ABI612_12880, partial [Betaproteobacteria bacterium]